MYTRCVFWKVGNGKYFMSYLFTLSLLYKSLSVDASTSEVYTKIDV